MGISCTRVLNKKKKNTILVILILPCLPLLSLPGLWPPHLFAMENNMIPILIPLPTPSTFFLIFIPNFPEPTSQIPLACSTMGISGSCPPAPSSHSTSTPSYLGTLCFPPGCKLLPDPSLSEDLRPYHVGKELWYWGNECLVGFQQPEHSWTTPPEHPRCLQQEYLLPSSGNNFCDHLPLC